MSDEGASRGGGLSNPEAFAGRLKARLHAAPPILDADERASATAPTSAEFPPHVDLEYLHHNWDATRADWTSVGESTILRRLRGVLRRLLRPLVEHSSGFAASTTRLVDRHEKAILAAQADLAMLRNDVNELRSAASQLNPVLLLGPDGVRDEPSRNALLETVATSFFRGPVVDLRCGRGSLLTYLRERGIDAVGFDERWDCVTTCNEHGLTAFTLGWKRGIESLADRSVAGVFIPQVLERLPLLDAGSLLVDCARVVSDDGVVVVELAETSHVADNLLLTGLRPIAPTSVAWTLEQLGFTSIRHVQHGSVLPPAVVDDVLVGPAALVIATRGRTR